MTYNPWNDRSASNEEHRELLEKIFNRDAIDGVDYVSLHTETNENDVISFRVIIRSNGAVLFFKGQALPKHVVEADDEEGK